MSKINFTQEIFERTVNECFAIKLIGAYLVFVFIAGVSLNLLLLWIFFLKKELRTPLNKFISALALCDLIGCVSEIPLIVISCFSCKYSFFHFYYLFVSKYKYPDAWINCSATPLLGLLIF